MADVLANLAAELATVTEEVAGRVNDPNFNNFSVTFGEITIEEFVEPPPAPLIADLPNDFADQLGAIVEEIEARKTPPKAQTTYAPRMHFLWNGVPFEELGIADIVEKATFATTVGRGRTSKRFKAGKPKVGGASIDFLVSTPDLVTRMVELIRVKARPIISVAAGYEDSGFVWIGSFRMADITWSYPQSGIVSCKMQGQTSKYMGLAQRNKARVYTKTSIRRILQGIANEHGIVLDIEKGALGTIDAEMQYIMKSVNESDWQFAARLSERAGYGGIFLKTESGLTPLTEAPQYAQGPSTSRLIRDLYTNQRHIMRVQKYPGFVDLARNELSRPLVIGVGHFIRDRDTQNAVDYLCQSCDIKEEAMFTGLTAIAKRMTKVNEDAKLYVNVASSLQDQTNPAVLKFVEGGVSLITGVAQKKLESLKRETQLLRRDNDDIPGASIYEMVASDLPEAVSKGEIGSARMFAIAVNNGFGFEATIKLFPAVPALIAGNSIDLVGTISHDGRWGVETSTLNFSSGGGLEQTLVCKPVGLGKAPSITPVSVSDIEKLTFTIAGSISDLNSTTEGSEQYLQFVGEKGLRLLNTKAPAATTTSRNDGEPVAAEP